MVSLEWTGGMGTRFGISGSHGRIRVPRGNELPLFTSNRGAAHLWLLVLDRRAGKSWLRSASLYSSSGPTIRLEGFPDSPLLLAFQSHFWPFSETNGKKFSNHTASNRFTSNRYPVSPRRRRLGHFHLHLHTNTRCSSASFRSC